VQILETNNPSGFKTRGVIKKKIKFEQKLFVEFVQSKNQKDSHIE